MTLNTNGVQFSSDLNYDQVIYAYTGSFGLTLNGAGTVIFSGINQYGLPLGIFSIDGGVTWSDIGVAYPLSLSINNIGLFVECNQYGNIFIQLTNPAGGSTAYTVQVKLVLLATDNPSILPNSIVSTTNPTAYEFGTNNNYRYIVSKNTQSLTSGTQYTYTHNQNAIPIAQTWSLIGSSTPSYTLYGPSVDAQWNGAHTLDYYIVAYTNTTMIYGVTDNYNTQVMYTRFYQQ